MAEKQRFRISLAEKVVSSLILLLLLLTLLRHLDIDLWKLLFLLRLFGLLICSLVKATLSIGEMGQRQQGLWIHLLISTSATVFLIRQLVIIDAIGRRLCANTQL